MPAGGGGGRVVSSGRGDCRGPVIPCSRPRPSGSTYWFLLPAGCRPPPSPLLSLSAAGRAPGCRSAGLAAAG